MNSIVEIIPHVYQITLRGVNIILIAEEELTLIDTGFCGSAPQIRGFIHSFGRSPKKSPLFSSLTTTLTTPVDWLNLKGRPLTKDASAKVQEWIKKIDNID